MDALDAGGEMTTAMGEASAYLPMNQALIIDYVDSVGAPSLRRVCLKEVFAAKHHVYLQGYCLERQAPRLFRRDRVRALFCGVTGEDLGDVEEALRPRFVQESSILAPPEVQMVAVAEAEEETNGLRRMRAALGVLMTIARADGCVHKNEKAVILDFISSVWADEFRNVALIAEALRIAPSFETFLESAADVFSIHDSLARAVINTAAPLCMADGDVTDGEIDVLKDLAELAGAHGLAVEMEVSDAR